MFLRIWKRATFILAALMAFVVTAPAQAKEDEVYTGLFSNVAVSGYDTVAYFTVGKPVKGDKKFTYEWKDAKWRFSSQENLDKFKADPEAYAPQYGGYCSWAVSQGYTASADPDNWTIVDGKLYLNYDDDVQADWEKDIPGFIASANKHWPELIK